MYVALAKQTFGASNSCVAEFGENQPASQCLAFDEIILAWHHGV
jgi:hypothetical protein